MAECFFWEIVMFLLHFKNANLPELKVLADCVEFFNTDLNWADFQISQIAPFFYYSTIAWKQILVNSFLQLGWKSGLKPISVMDISPH